MLKILSIASLLVVVGACSSQQQQSQELPAQQVTDESLNQNAKSQEGSGESLGAETNNATSDEFTNTSGSGNALLNVPTNNMTTTNVGAPQNAPMNAAPLNATAPMNGAAPLNASAAPANAAAPTNAAAAPAAAPVQMEGQEYTNPHMNWPGKGRVKYVRGSAAKHQQPAGQVVGNLEKGEHPLVIKEGEWAELSDGTYTPSSNLSEQGVGRAKRPAQWQQ